MGDSTSLNTADSFDWKHLKPESLATVQECADAMYELDGIVGRISADLGEARARVQTEGVYSDPTWFRNASVSLKECKRKRVRVQERKSALHKLEKQDKQNAIERRFIEVAKKLLTEDQIGAIWDEVHQGE